ncbi:type II toxin-antitoxin system RelE/ParE family toxin (plasmid) [Candidatus Fukatsuia symbiotica]|uniref:Plasmid stabilization protein n=1 Tax=Candidatus Fukatsuia symbiotica TaxID=1878942 RepID=A0A2U8I8P5_9GAMM|nr:type II toxin-antitoxin system RelE/ParE family toxin [Candidatus Fukatsuia symbiotica]AWK15487.1 plasmid stabilization protein [Candidatus Fukatsuia symbiotica]MEA9445875.1 type II toxin-antitoxin system RelE/ParE family toxin [Candidatus Fukatsuia symbiotica]
MTQLELSGYIEGDLDDIADYIGQDNPGRAVTFIREIRTKFYDIQCNPLLYQLRPDIGEEARMATVGRYAILFRVMANIVRIERVAYCGRNLVGIFTSE